MSTFPFCCAQQKPASTNGLLSVSPGSGEQFVSIKQDRPHLRWALSLPVHIDSDGFCAAGKKPAGRVLFELTLASWGPCGLLIWGPKKEQKRKPPLLCRLMWVFIGLCGVFHHTLEVRFSKFTSDYVIRIAALISSRKVWRTSATLNSKFILAVCLSASYSLYTARFLYSTIRGNLTSLIHLSVKGNNYLLYVFHLYWRQYHTPPILVLETKWQLSSGDISLF